MGSATSSLIIGFINDFIIIAGGIISGAMLATKEITMPTAPVLVLALIMGVVQAARRAQSKLDPSPLKEGSDPDIRTPAKLEAQIKVNEATIATIVDRVTDALKDPAPVTPKRVDAPAPKPVKDSS